MAINLKDAIRSRTQPAKGQPYQVGITTSELDVTTIRTDGGTQARAEISAPTVEEYAQAMQEGAQFPAVVVYYDGADYWLADGFHRVEAARRLGRAVQADIRPGTRRDAVLWAVGANDAHGLRRTRGDVQRAIETLLRDSEWGQWADREIARQVHCDHKTVAAARARLSGEIPQIEGEGRTVARGGSVYVQKPRRSAQDQGEQPKIRSGAGSMPSQAAAEPLRVRLREAGAGMAWCAERAAGLAAAERAALLGEVEQIAEQVAALIAALGGETGGSMG